MESNRNHGYSYIRDHEEGQFSISVVVCGRIFYVDNAASGDIGVRNPAVNELMDLQLKMYESSGGSYGYSNGRLFQRGKSDSGVRKFCVPNSSTREDFLKQLGKNREDQN